MGSTFHSLHFHIVFSTKERRPFIEPQIQNSLFEYMAGIIIGLDGIPISLGGVSDHVHLLISLKPRHCLADVVREIKKASSSWMHEKPGQKYFSWQEGYAAFTLGATSKKSVRGYIENQAEHHRKKSFREELKELLIRAEIEFEEQYLD